MTRLHKLTGLVVCACLGWASPVTADVVTHWNNVTVQAIALASPARPGPSSFLDFAVVHAAIHDAIQSYDNRFEAYHVHIDGATGSVLAAAAKAARDVLVGRLPGAAAHQFAEDRFQEYLKANSLLVTDPGVGVGEKVAAAILQLRANDGAFPASFPPFTGGTNPGEWRSTTVPATPMVAAWLGVVTPFVLKDPAQLRASSPPPALTSGLYTRDYDEVLRLGGKNNSQRSQEQTNLAMFYSDNFILLLERTLRQIAEDHVGNIGDSGRLFALANFAAADALITAWDSKVYWNFWRPVTAIHEGEDDGNPRTPGDPSWEPFLVAPNYPDYTSGANNEGIHFRFADAVARRQGKRAADWAEGHSLRPLQ